jgi:negative regulator of flagellin synthesis FlgM
VTKQPQAAPTPTVAAQLAASAPVDVERVARIKEAIAKGTFPLSPSTIADALIAARYEWMSNDKA